MCVLKKGLDSLSGNLNFETIMSAIKSNTGRFGYKNVRLTLRRTEKSIPRSTETIRRLEAITTEEPSVPVKNPRDGWER